MRKPLVAVLALVVLPVAACKTIVRNTAAAFAEDVVERDLKLPNLARLWSCVESLEPTCDGGEAALPADASAHICAPPGLREAFAGKGLLSARTSAAFDVLEHDVQVGMCALFRSLCGLPPEHAGHGAVVWIDEQAAAAPGGAESFTGHVPVIPFDASGLDDYMGAVEDAATLEAWDALDRDFARMFAGEGFDDSLARQAWLLGRQSAFAKAYFKAYFRGGRFLEARLDGSQLLDKVRADLQEQLEGIGDPELRDTLVLQELTRLVGLFAPNADPERVREIVEEVWSGNYTSINELLTLGKIRDEGFVTRSGTKYQFPAISVEIDPLRDEPLQVTQVDFKAVGNELVVVLVEAMFDGMLATPCVDEATGAGLPDGLRLPRFVDDDAGVTADQFRSVDSNAQRLGGLAGASIGRLVRGLGWISLDNEALAGLVESLFATVVQKSVEKVLWCYFRCEVAGAGLWDTGLEGAWGGGVQRVRISLTGLTREP